ncbi:MAG: response regulator transcription factor [Elusimicrobia bacterium]|nr:response regulator transcription factor [Elusimicrobiota bacterium]
MPRLLIIEDETAIVKAVEKTLTMSPGFSLDWVSDPDKAVSEAVSRKPDLILLDVRLPGGDGRVILQALKENTATRGIPVILLTGLANEGDKVLGLNLGADDYVVKPFGALELMARITAVLRRSGPAAGARRLAKAGGLEMDSGERSVLLDGRSLRLQPREFEVLFLLAAHAGKTLSRDFLIEHTSGYGRAVPTRSLDTHIKNLRRKLGAKGGMILTVPKLGYRLEP